MNKNRYYFDYAASSFGNPSSKHKEGEAAKKALEDARSRCAGVLGVPSDTLFFTSGGTESNAIAFFSVLAKPGKGRTLSSAAEHSSVREAMNTLEKAGKPVGSIPVDSEGRITPELLLKSLEKYNDIRFVSVMAVNNETGTVTNIPALRDLLPPPVHFHCDIVQALGKIPVNLTEWNIDSASISTHKIGGPAGTGLLYLKRGSKTEVFYKGGGQENGIRGGTENVEGACALADCLEKFVFPSAVEANYEKAAARWNKLITELSSINRCSLIPRTRTPDSSLLTPDSSLLPSFSPYILQAAFKDIPGEVMARALDDMGFAVSTGSACSSSSPERPVLLEMGIEEKLRIEGIRISQGYNTTNEEIDLLVNAIKEILNFL